MAEDDVRNLLQAHQARMEQLDEVAKQALEGQIKLTDTVTKFAENHNQLVEALKIQKESYDKRFKAIEDRQDAQEAQMLQASRRAKQQPQLPATTQTEKSDPLGEFGEGFIEGITGKWLLGGKE